MEKAEARDMYFIDTGFSCNRVSGNPDRKRKDISVYFWSTIFVWIYILLLGVYVQCTFLCLPDILGKTVVF